MNAQEAAKRKAAEAALAYVEPGEVLGVGTGSTVNHFIDLLVERKLAQDIPGAVSSSNATTQRLKKAGIRVLDLNQTGTLPLYVDGADEANAHLQLIKGGGGALTREKIIAAASRKFVCIVDESKLVGVLGRFPLPVEVIPMARSYIGRELTRLGGHPVLRDGFVTDNGNLILDVHHLDIVDPVRLENEINGLAGVVCVGLFARRPADVLIVGSSSGTRVIKATASGGG
ncbi:ribose-5-phosphate isomerase [Fontimonas thermophila]|uniref:Ribose-5-phosphate isomerase A n=1 Tax=Fontimonas thermophila TaxID=1076937 RepID=A0A1I2J2D4_9GAMM|nr:ribose-5-phosphate isomerase RpiA [Fontimonas thermophila]SFF48599.1 ribose-5-phosphate isomerase [Fontimonas thermophila]